MTLNIAGNSSQAIGPTIGEGAGGGGRGGGGRGDGGGNVVIKFKYFFRL